MTLGGHMARLEPNRWMYRVVHRDVKEELVGGLLKKSASVKFMSWKRINTHVGYSQLGEYRQNFNEQPIQPQY